MKVAVFGAGTMGSGIAQVFAAKGHTALMYASSVASAQKHKDKLAASLAKRVAKGKMPQEAVDALLANVLVEEKSAAAVPDSFPPENWSIHRPLPDKGGGLIISYIGG